MVAVASDSSLIRVLRKGLGHQTLATRLSDRSAAPRRSNCKCHHGYRPKHTVVALTDCIITPKFLLSVWLTFGFLCNGASHLDLPGIIPQQNQEREKEKRMLFDAMPRRISSRVKHKVRPLWFLTGDECRSNKFHL